MTMSVKFFIGLPPGSGKKEKYAMLDFKWQLVSSNCGCHENFRAVLKNRVTRLRDHNLWCYEHDRILYKQTTQEQCSHSGSQIFDPYDYESVFREGFLHSSSVIHLLTVSDTLHSQEVRRLHSVWLICCPSDRNDTRWKGLDGCSMNGTSFRRWRECQR